MKGHTLVAQEIRQRIIDKEILVESKSLDLNRKGYFSDDLLEKQIQPASFDPTTSSIVYEIDTDSEGVFRPAAHVSIKDVLQKLGPHRVARQDCSLGYELKKGFTYLIPLKEKVVLRDGEYIKASPKSSIGRVFLYTRLLADFNPCFDEVSSYYMKEKKVGLYLLVQPLAFNVIIYPDLALNQLRFMRGTDVMLSPSEVREECREFGLLLEHNDKQDLVPVEPKITDALQIHLDIKGDRSNGIVGLRARKKPKPIDMKQVGVYDIAEFFEPVYANDERVTIKSGEYYLFASKEVLKIPEHLSVELKSYSHVGISGLLHFAGFIDNNFCGDLVFEIRSDEITDVVLQDGMPISKLEIFRGSIPNKLYGKGIGSNYHGQIGPKPSKYFKKIDYSKF